MESVIFIIQLFTDFIELIANKIMNFDIVNINNSSINENLIIEKNNSVDKNIETNSTKINYYNQTILNDSIININLNDDNTDNDVQILWYTANGILLLLILFLLFYNLFYKKEKDDFILTEIEKKFPSISNTGHNSSYSSIIRNNQEEDTDK